MSSKVKISIATLLLAFNFFVVFSPSFVSAQGLVPCGTTSVNGVVSNPCKWGDFFTLITNVTNFLIILGAAFSAVAFGWAGFLMLTSGGEMSKIEHGKQIFGHVLIGFLIMLSAWLIVHAINSGLISSDFFGQSGIQAI